MNRVSCQDGRAEGEGCETVFQVKNGRQKVTVTDPHALMLVAENRRRK